MISVELKVVGGKHAGQSIPLDRKKFLIGREQDCQLRPNTELVSRHHCIFTVDDYSVRLRDLGSTNGTSVNGETIRREVVLNQGDLVTVGNLQFQIVVNEFTEGAKTGSISAATDETIVTGSETLSEMTPVQPEEQLAAPSTPPTPEAVSAEPAVTAPQPIDPAVPAAPTTDTVAVPIPGQPASMGDTTVISQQAMMPGQMPYQPMQQPAGYPPMYGQQPYPGMPMQYPGQPYPGQPYPPQPYPGQQFAQPFPTQQMPMQPAPQPVVEQEPAKAAAEPAVDVSLPDPATTGAKVDTPPPPAAKPADGEEQAPAAEKSNQTADAIIKQYMQKRPGG